MRHSFISYSLAKEGVDPVELAKWCGNSVAVINQHYREVVTKEQAAEYWKITPESL
jgi:hypothetical protein